MPYLPRYSCAKGFEVENLYIFGVTADKLREMWESGVENPGGRDQILASLNTNLAYNVVCACSAELWRWGARKEKVAVNVNINDIELESGTS